MGGRWLGHRVEGTMSGFSTQRGLRGCKGVPGSLQGSSQNELTLT